MATWFISCHIKRSLLMLPLYQPTNSSGYQSQAHTPFLPNAVVVRHRRTVHTGFGLNVLAICSYTLNLCWPIIITEINVHFITLVWWYEPCLVWSLHGCPSTQTNFERMSGDWTAGSFCFESFPVLGSGQTRFRDPFMLFSKRVCRDITAADRHPCRRHR